MKNTDEVLRSHQFRLSWLDETTHQLISSLPSEISSYESKSKKEWESMSECVCMCICTLHFSVRHHFMWGQSWTKQFLPNDLSMVLKTLSWLLWVDFYLVPVAGAVDMILICPLEPSFLYCPHSWQPSLHCWLPMGLSALEKGLARSMRASYDFFPTAAGKYLD